MPLITKPLNMTWFQSMAVSPGGMPSMEMLPPWFMVRNMSRNAVALPDISNPTSKPSSMPKSRMASSKDSRDTLSALDAPIFAARLEPIVVHVRDDDVPGAAMPCNRHRHDADRAGARDEHVLADDV